MLPVGGRRAVQGLNLELLHLEPEPGVLVDRPLQFGHLRSVAGKLALPRKNFGGEPILVLLGRPSPARLFFALLLVPLEVASRVLQLLAHGFEVGNLLRQLHTSL